MEDRCRKAERDEGEKGRGGQEQEVVHYSHNSTFALLCLDLDSFKPINDNFGHQKGDQVLNELANVFRSTVRASDIVARYGGDEFLIVLDGADEEAARSMCERLREAVANYDPDLIHPKLGALHLGVSVGYACFPKDGQDCATLLSAADTQMYHEKTERKLGSLAGKGESGRGSYPVSASRGLSRPENLFVSITSCIALY